MTRIEPVGPPVSIEAEEALLAALLIDPDTWWNAGVTLRPDDFYLIQNRQAFEACAALVREKRPIDFLTLSETMERMTGEPPDPVWISMLIDGIPTALHAKTYADIIREKAARRKMIEIATRLATSAYNEKEDADDLLRRTEGELLAIRRTAANDGKAAGMFDQLYDQVMDWAEHPLQAGETRYLSTGMRSLDDALGGLQPGLYLIAARPSMGKTAFVLQIAANIVKRGLPVLFFTLEMGEKQLGLRLACSEARVPMDRVTRGIATPEEHYRVVEALDMFRKSPLSIHYGGSLRPADVRSIAHCAICEGDVKLVVVDGMWLMAAGREGENRNLELGSISRELKLMADSLALPIVAVHQLSRTCESRGDKRPLLSDLRESGRLEEDADIVLILYRDGYYDQKSANANIMEVINRKNRLGGPSGDTVRMYWQGEYMRCEQLARPIKL